MYKVISDVLSIDTSSINEATGPDNVESWDSFNALMLISEFEEVFNLKFTMPEVEHIKSVKNIIEVLKKKRVKFPDE